MYSWSNTQNSVTLQNKYYILCILLKIWDIDLVSMFRKVHKVPSYLHMPEAVYAIYKGAQKSFHARFRINHYYRNECYIFIHLLLLCHARNEKYCLEQYQY